MNFVRAHVAGGAVRFAGASVPLPAGTSLGGADRPVILGVRPTGLSLADGATTITVVPTLVEDLGDERYVIFELDAQRVDTDATRAAVDALTADDALLTPDQRARFTVRLPSDAPVSIGEPLELTVNPSRLYFFDPDTGDALA
jgi:multiple sugar transport system ATP-binding protein